MNKKIDRFFKCFFTFFGLLAIIFLILIVIFITIEGIKPFLPNNSLGSINFWDFLFGLKWDPTHHIYGIGYMILGTLLATLLALVIAIPLSILSSLAIVNLDSKKLRNILISIIELLSGIPSIIFGMIGMEIIIPLIKNIGFNPYPQGNSLLAVSIVLAMMIIPTITAVSISSLQAVPNIYKEASLGLGASKIQTLIKIILPSAKRGILSGIVLGVGRAIGETMAVILVAGNVSGGLVDSIFAPIRPLTANIAMDMAYASGLHKEVLFSTALVLFVIIFIINIVMNKIIQKGIYAKNKR